MTQQIITVPIALSVTRSATLTLPWFVQRTEYNPAPATFQPLVNGEEAFAQVYDAILQARHSVDIICWGFQPSMYFKRGGSGNLPIGQLLANKGNQGVRVRLLCWSDDLHVAQWAENMTPGNNIATSLKPGALNAAQREFDLAWYRRAHLNNATKRSPGPLIPAYIATRIASDMGQHIAQRLQQTEPLHGVEFATRDFTLPNRVEVAWRTWLHGADSQRDVRDKAMQSAAMGLAVPTHHQKMVLIDYDAPDRADQAIGFVMGHNMLDPYWDKDDHSAVRKNPQTGRNGEHPRQDISSRVGGPILQYLNLNFCQAWDQATGQQLGKAREAIAQKLTLRRDGATPVMAQILRTQSQHGARDIETMYLQAVNNATQFIYIENQYFRFVPLADKIKAAAAKQVEWGRDPGQHGPIHLFVVTNASDEGIGAGTVNTYRMLDALGRADTIPGVAQLERQDALRAQYERAVAQEAHAGKDVASALEVQRYTHAENGPQKLAEAQQHLKQVQAEKAELKAQLKELPEKTIMPEEIPGLKVHICTLVAPDSPPGNWEYVYIHSKLMIVDDVFTTLGSANINTRSMEGDSELNICHEHAGVTQPLRRRLWDIHTKGLGAQDKAAEAFKAWTGIIKQNTENQTNGLAPYASLVGFKRDSAARTYLD